MITCWGDSFKSVEELWRSPRCYVSTATALRHRLKTLPPEEAVNPRRFKFGVESYQSIYMLHRQCGELLSLTELYRRLGLIFNKKKLTPYQAVFQWHLFRQMPRTGVFGTTLEI